MSENISRVSTDEAGKHVFHYTDAAGLIGIFKDRCVWATDAAFMNDSLEIKHGARIAGDVFMDTAKQFEGDGTTRHTRLKGMADILYDLFGGEKVPLNTPYIACFSEANDRLSQWRGYANGGYAIKFDREALTDSLGTAFEGDPEIKPPKFVKVTYGDAPEVLIETAKTVAQELAEGSANPAFLGKYNMINTRLSEVISSSKSDAFDEENEWRIIAETVEPMTMPLFRPSNMGPRPFVRVPISLGSVRAVIAGPGPEARLRIESARRLVDLALHNAPDLEDSYSHRLGVRYELSNVSLRP